MGQIITVTGMILSAAPVGEYDRRIVILTKERGKLTAFAKGARKQTSRFLAATNPFSFGQFELYEGRTSYNLQQVFIQNYFRELADDFTAACYGFYFMEFADYYARENADDAELLKLLYQTFRAVIQGKIDYELIRYIFELKAMTINGEYPQVFQCVNCMEPVKAGAFLTAREGILCEKCCTTHEMLHPSTIYTMQYIISTSIQKLYTFTVSEEVFIEFRHIMKGFVKRHIDKTFHSLEILG